MRPRRVRPFAILAALLAAAAGSAATEPEPDLLDLELGVAPWRFASPLADAQGTAVWVRCPDGSWRLDVALGEPGEEGTGTAEAALGRLGEGWTAVSPGDGTLVVQAWDGPLRELEPAQADRLRALLSLAESAGDPARAQVAPAVWRDRRGRSGPAPRTPWDVRASADAIRDLIWPAPDDDGSPLARDLASRGRGRGGAGESWRCDAAADGGIRLHGLRWGATLEAGPSRRAIRRGDPLEVVLPLWPLGEVLAEGGPR